MVVCNAIKSYLWQYALLCKVVNNTDAGDRVRDINNIKTSLW